MKRLISIIISTMLILTSVFTQSGFASDEVVTLEKEITVLSQLGYLQSTPDNINGTLTRGQFTKILVSIMNGEIINAQDVMITDINEFHDYYMDMSRAIKLGLVNGPATRADDAITFNEAVKMVVCMLGYNQYALHMGGWPTGYHRIAHDIGILEGISNGDENHLLWSDALVLLYNAICTDVLEPFSIGEDVTYATTEGRTILTQSHSIMASEGIVESAKGRTLEKDDGLNEGDVIINGKRLTSNYSDMSKYVGMNVRYWYNKTDVLCAIWPENNKVVTVDAESVYDFQNRVLVYDEEIPGKQYGVERKIPFSPMATIIYNDVVIDNFNNSYFLGKQGEFTFIDNNGDNKYDVIILDITEDYVVKKADTYSSTIFDLYDDSKSLNLSDKDGADVSFVDGYGRPMFLSELMRYDVISVKKSYDAKKITAIFSNHEVRGTVEAVSQYNDKLYVTIKGTQYATTTDFAKYEKLEIGEWGVFGITSTGKIACINRGFTAEGSFYGYLIKGGGEVGLDAQYQYKVLSQEGDIVILTSAKKLSVDGVSMKSDEAYQHLGGTNIIPQPIIYDINNDGLISSIDTISYNENEEHRDSLKEMYSCYDSSYDEDGNLIETARTSLEWRGSTGIFGSRIPTHNGTVFFKVSASKDASDDEFQVSNLSSLPMEYFSFKAYKTVEDAPIADIIVMYSSDVSQTSGNTHYLVSKITEGMDEKDNTVTKLYLYNGRNEQVLYVKDKAVFANAKWVGADPLESGLNHDFVAGDIIKLSTDTTGYVNNIELVYDRVGNEFYTSTYYNEAGANAQVRISFNEVYLNYSGTLFVHKGPIPDGTESLDYDSLESYNASDFTILIFDPEDRESVIKTGSISDISDYKSTGQGSMIFLQTTYTTSGVIVLYRNLQ